MWAAMKKILEEHYYSVISVYSFFTYSLEGIQCFLIQ